MEFPNCLKHVDNRFDIPHITCWIGRHSYANLHPLIHRVVVFITLVLYWLECGYMVISLVLIEIRTMKLMYVVISRRYIHRRAVWFVAEWLGWGYFVRCGLIPIFGDVLQYLNGFMVGRRVPKYLTAWNWWRKRRGPCMLGLVWAIEE